MDYAETAYQQRIAEGTFDNYACGLVAESDDGSQSVEFVIGDTDSPPPVWLARHDLPSTRIECNEFDY